MKFFTPCSFKPINLEPSAPPFTPIIVRRDMNCVLQFSPDYKGKERRFKLAVTTWLGPEEGFLNPEMHWQEYLTVPPLSKKDWISVDFLIPPASSLLLLFMRKGYNTPERYISAGWHLGTYASIEKEWKVRKRIQSLNKAKCSSWLTVPNRVVEKWLLLEKDCSGNDQKNHVPCDKD